MTKEEAIQVLETIQKVYPKSDMSIEKAKMLIPKLLVMDHQLVMEKLAAHVATHAYAPTIAEIAAYPPVPNDFLEKRKRWMEEAAKVPSEVKQAFYDKINKLIQDMGK